MKKLISVVLFLTVLAGGMLFAAGGAQQGAAATIRTPAGQFPVDAGDTPLRYWVALGIQVSPNFVNLGDTPLGQALRQKTGINVEFVHPPATAVLESLNLMIASGEDMPDIIEYNWFNMPGGPERYIIDGVILALNDLIQNYSPHLRGYFDANPDVDLMSKTDEGNYYTFPFFRGHEELLYSQGLSIRKDWLDDLGMQPPATLDDWRNALVAFRDVKNASAPFTTTWGARNRMFMPTFGFLQGMYISHEDGNMRYGQMQPGYRRWVETMAGWYAEGLIDRDIMSVNNSARDRRMINGESGATIAPIGSGMAWPCRKGSHSWSMVFIAKA